jgi:hypothetical protein
MHDNMRLIDLLPVLVIGLLLLVVRIALPVLGTWIVLIWFALAFVSMWITTRHIPTTRAGLTNIEGGQ